MSEKHFKIDTYGIEKGCKDQPWKDRPFGWPAEFFSERSF